MHGEMHSLQHNATSHCLATLGICVVRLSDHGSGAGFAAVMLIVVKRRLVNRT